MTRVIREHFTKDFRRLLIDDNEFIRNSMEIAFRQKGYPLRTAKTAEEGLEKMAVENFDIIISDFKLSGMNGMDFFKITGMSKNGSVNVLISGNIQEDELDDKESSGIHQFVENPFTVLSLAGTLARLIDNRENILSSMD